jgi:biopolymer transport protein ExbD
MASASPSHDDDIVATINVTPLVDITLVLLIIFMVTAKMIAQTGIPMDLPQAASAGTTQSVFTVSVDPEGAVFANGKPVASDDELRAAARAAMSANPETRTVIQAAGSARHSAVLHAMDELRESGVTKIAFAADKSPRGQASAR